MQRPGPPHTAHHLIRDVQDAVFVAQAADPLQIARRRRRGSRRRPHHGFGTETDDRFRAGLKDGLLQLIKQALGILLLGLVSPAIAVLIAGGDADNIH